MNSTQNRKQARSIVVDALSVIGPAGATKDEIVDLLTQDFQNPAQSIGKVLAHMVDEKVAVMWLGKYYLKEFAPEKQRLPSAAPVHSNGSAGVRPIAPMMQKRVGKRVSLYTTPRIWEDAVAVSLLIKEQWLEIPFFVPIRVCIGQIIPDWSAEKRSYYNVSIVKIISKNGKVDEENPASKDIVTIDVDIA